VKLFRGGLVFKAHRLLYHSTLGLRVIKKKKKRGESDLELRVRRDFEAEEPLAVRQRPPLVLELRVHLRNPSAGQSGTECSGSEAGSYLSLIDFCITQF